MSEERMVFQEREAVTHDITPEPVQVKKAPKPSAEDKGDQDADSQKTDADRG